MEVEQERDFVHGRDATMVTILVIAVSTLFVLVAWALTVHWQGDDATSVSALQPLPRDIGAMELTHIENEAPGLSLEAEQRRHLHGFGWVDREARLIHIPIEAAMKLYLERQPELDKPNPAEGNDSERTSP